MHIFIESFRPNFTIKLFLVETIGLNSVPTLYLHRDFNFYDVITRRCLTDDSSFIILGLEFIKDLDDDGFEAMIAQQLASIKLHHQLKNFVFTPVKLMMSFAVGGIIAVPTVFVFSETIPAE